MFEIETLIVLIPLLPLLAAVVTAALGRHVLGEASHQPAVMATVGSFLMSLVLLARIAGAPAPDISDGSPAPVGREWTTTLWTWAALDDAYRPQSGEVLSSHGADALPETLGLNLDVTLRADPLTSIMLSMVLFVSSLVVIYASGYMHGDPGYWRFFTYVSLFVFSMTMLVSVSSFALLYVFWEAVGVCSYLLIGFWYEKPEAAAAGKKAFLVNRVGDFGFALAVFLIWLHYGTLNFHDAGGLAGVLGQTRLASGQFVGGGVGLAICLLLLLGACGKSAQFPLHVWLPDAMEGPTPVSALIHAATMVTAGVYLVARATPLFMIAPDAQPVVAAIGCFTALLAGLIALTQTDLKRVLAYSTISQLGYMFLALGTGSLAGIVAGMFHLFTHAFFKALLFLGAGSVMHAMGGVIDMRQFSGLRRVMPATHKTFLIGALALAGIVPFAGFWSKDAIVAAVHDRAGHGALGELVAPLAQRLGWQTAAHEAPHNSGHDSGHGETSRVYALMYLAALVTAFLTAFYTFRAFFLTFHGPERIPPEAGHHAHESPPVMTTPLWILAGCATIVGVYFEWTHGFAHYLAQTPSLAASLATARGGVESLKFHPDIAAFSTLIALSGVGLAAFLYLGDAREISLLTRAMQRAGLYGLSQGKFFFDPIYRAIVIWPVVLLSSVSYWFDRNVIDAAVNFVGRLPLWLGTGLRRLQGGLVQFYALFMVMGLLAILVGTLVMWQPR